ncbi:Fibrinogen-like protein A [Holothuria leucospilota]|uniref:Fibrinogen-like protein A n=1 Tax=Holothuria leucospilota TaxID=206669 RepID=A0A9Q1BUN1_HOLLE|nr:Fibrinogen-like protein A [Holothuria leucospilota]
MELKVLNHFVVQFSLICFLVKGSILDQVHLTSSTNDLGIREIVKKSSSNVQLRIQVECISYNLMVFWSHSLFIAKVIQRRANNFIDFNRNWTEYSNGFGFLNSDFWVGNEKLAYLTNQKQYELNISFETEKEESYHVTYSMFRISDSFSEFTLVSVGEFTGTLGDLPTRPPTDCYDIQQAGNTTSGDYIVNPTGWSGGPFTINCNMTIDGEDGRYSKDVSTAPYHLIVPGRAIRRDSGIHPENSGWETTN